MGQSANFSVVAADDSAVVIRDEGPWDRHLTVTNDAEGVVRRLYDSGQLVHGRSLFYFDSSGDFDEIEHTHGRFVRFKPGPRRPPV